MFCEIHPPDDFPLLFYREPQAPDMTLAADELDLDAVRAARVFWTTGTGLSAEPSREATLAALAAREGGITVHDLDHRPMFWSDESEAGHWARAALRHATVAVGNRDEVAVAVRTRDPYAASAALLELGVEIAVVKRGPEGVLARTRDELVEVEPVPVEVVNGLGAGDAFGGALVYGLLNEWPLERTIRLANAAGRVRGGAARVRGRDAVPGRHRAAGGADMRLTVAQALVRFLAAQEIERDGERRRFFAGCFGIFGHGNLAGLGQALQQHQDLLPFHQARNEQAMVHLAAGYARQRNRLGAYACTTSVGPGATNMVTGAALATINRLPVLLLPSDTFATRAPHPVLQQLEAPHDATVSVNDCFRPVSRFFDRISRPEQLVSAALEAMRVLTDPAETGAVTLALPEDVQTEAVEVPEAFLEPRVWTVYRRAAGARGAGAGGRAGAGARAAADRGRRRRHLRRGDRRAGRARRRDRHPGRRDAGGPRRAALRPSVVARRDRRHRHAGGQPAGARGRPGDRRRHALERLHDRLASRRSRTPTCGS